jgi:hypothetical protein
VGVLRNGTNLSVFDAVDLQPEASPRTRRLARRSLICPQSSTTCLARLLLHKLVVRSFAARSRGVLVVGAGLACATAEGDFPLFACHEQSTSSLTSRMLKIRCWETGARRAIKAGGALRSR